MSRADAQPVVLLVEDDEIQREDVRRMLGSSFEVTEASTLDEARAVLGELAADCVILDYRLPDGLGIELLPSLAERGIAVVMLTAQGNERVAVAAMKAGCHDYLVKRELNRFVLERALHHALERASLERELAETRRELEDFVAIAAHDLLRPVRHIYSFTELAEEAYDEGNTEAGREYLSKVRRSAERLSGLTRALLDYTQVGAERQPSLEVDLGDTFDALVAEVAPTIAEEGATVTRGELPTVIGDPDRLSQLLHNLVGNALKYRRDVPPVVRVQAVPQGEHWQITVTDNGRGIPADAHEAIFEPLRRLVPGDVEGFGVGLSTCQRIVDRHGGRIWVASSSDEGTTFAFTLPAVARES